MPLSIAVKNISSQSPSSPRPCRICALDALLQTPPFRSWPMPQSQPSPSVSAPRESSTSTAHTTGRHMTRTRNTYQPIFGYLGCAETTLLSLGTKKNTWDRRNNFSCRKLTPELPISRCPSLVLYFSQVRRL